MNSNLEAHSYTQKTYLEVVENIVCVITGGAPNLRVSNISIENV